MFKKIWWYISNKGTKEEMKEYSKNMDKILSSLEIIFGGNQHGTR